MDLNELYKKLIENYDPNLGFKKPIIELLIDLNIKKDEFADILFNGYAENISKYTDEVMFDNMSIEDKIKYINAMLKFMSPERVNNICKSIGLFQTPKNVAELIANFLWLFTPRKVLDPACGIGTILSYSNKENVDFYGIDLDLNAIKIASKLNPNIKFLNKNFLQDNLESKYDAIISDFPFVKIFGNKTLDLLFLERSLDLLNPNGVLIAIISNTINDSIYIQDLKSKILNNYSLELLLEVPTSLSSNIKSNIIMIKNASQRDQILYLHKEFFDNALDYYKNDKGENWLSINEMRKKWNVPFKAIPPIIDNRNGRNLSSIIKQLLSYENIIKLIIATGYFYVSGFEIIKEDLQNLYNRGIEKSFLLIIGDETDLPTKKQLIKGYTKQQQKFDKKFLSVNNNNVDENISSNVYRKYIEDINKARYIEAESRLQIISQDIEYKIETIDIDESTREGKIVTLYNLIEDGILDVRIYNKEKFHAKAYIIEQDIGNDILVRAIHGSSNFTFPGFKGNTELNSYHEGTMSVGSQTDIKMLESWFENIWEESTPFNSDLLRIVKKSTPYRRRAPTQPDKEKDLDPLYLSPLWFIRKIIFTYLNQLVDKAKDYLLEFQKIGVENIIDKFRDFDGCLVADSVGLGKSFIGAEIARLYYNYQQFDEKEGTWVDIPKNITFLLPANIQDQWRSILEDETTFNVKVDGIKVKMFSQEKFSQLNEKEIIKNFSNTDLFIIDEAHRFRNRKSNRYEYLEKIKEERSKEEKNTQFLLLTATPLSNSVEDIKNLIDIFTNDTRLNNLGLKPDAFYAYNRISTLERRNERLNDFQIEEKERSLKYMNEILNNVMLLRTRTAIKERYPNLILRGKKIEFSNPRIESLSYDFSKEWNIIKESLIDVNNNEIHANSDPVTNFIATLKLPHITISSGYNGETIACLYKILLLKRLESSIYAFINSIEKIKSNELELKAELNRSDANIIEIIKSRRKKLKSDYETDVDNEQENDLLTFLEFEKDDDKEAENIAKEQLIKKKLDEFKANILEDIEFDINRIIAVMNKVKSDLKLKNSNQYEYIDNKLLYLLEFLKNKYFTDKLLIFTQFRDTAEYLGYHLQKHLQKLNIEVIMGGKSTSNNDNTILRIKMHSSGDKMNTVKRFSPSSYECEVDESDIVLESIKSYTIDKNNEDIIVKYTNNEIKAYTKIGKLINILVTTDTLSEGVNLQECNHVINYDLPWNPTRIIQRVGRIDRIGSNEQKYVYNIKASKDIDNLLNLIRNISVKINDIALIVGREYGILSEEEEINIKTIGEKILLKDEDILKELKVTDTVIDENKLKEIQKNYIINKVMDKIQTFDNSRDIDSLEGNISKSTLFKQVAFGESVDSEIRTKLREIIWQRNLDEQDFKKYAQHTTDGSYCIIDANGKNIQRKYAFVYYKIYIKGLTPKNIIITIDEKDEYPEFSSLDENNIFKELNPLDIMIDEQGYEGLTISQLREKKGEEILSNVLNKIEQIKHFFEEIYLPSFKKKFSAIKKAKLGKQDSWPSVQNWVNLRLEDIYKNRSGKGKGKSQSLTKFSEENSSNDTNKSQVSLSTIQNWIDLFSRTPFRQTDANVLVKMFGFEKTSKELETTILNMKENDFFDIIVKFVVDIISKRQEYKESNITSRHISNSLIIWGAFV